ncbi:DivIVA domain-containing protein [Plantactinospora soyae]|uniref:Cell division protein DivIVA n=1 Tax=Plantactinospora soyae TaxID=1544732 RepID=A0A927M893_9ACTN|nr:DivIVA domain-containing protein [Plantactinospora soyae]MBE1489993.1 hypothetical protein [Plantactinospora soyae]
MAEVYRGGRAFSGGSPDWLTPHEVRTRRFAPRRLGVDGEQVRAFQLRLADELSVLVRELTMARTENARLRRVLRDWQTTHARTCNRPQPPRGNSGHW